MKCPKCGYTSFDYLDACKRCKGDLRDARTLLQIIAVSPEERVPSPPPAAAQAPAPEPEVFAADPGAPSEDTVFEGLDMDESFDDLLERTSLDDSGSGAAPAAAAKPAQGKPGEDEDLLDLDFGDLFGDGPKSTQ